VIDGNDITYVIKQLDNKPLNLYSGEDFCGVQSTEYPPILYTMGTDYRQEHLRFLMGTDSEREGRKL
jgi:hypothetical protein